MRILKAAIPNGIFGVPFSFFKQQDKFVLKAIFDKRV
jgi:hypothetical protein